MSAPCSVTASLVLYRNDPGMIRGVLGSLRDQPCTATVCVVDNSPTPELRSVVEEFGAKYLHDPSNPGFGASHNHAVRELPRGEFHLIVNPDVYFPPETVPSLVEFARQERAAGLVSPRVLFPNGELQYVCKRYPSLFLLFGRRFMPGPLQKLMKRRMDWYEMRDTGYAKVMDVPYASGCFMLFRREVYERIGGFDERFFLHFEDADITRRVVQAGFRVLFDPDAHVFHHWARGSHTSLRMTLTTIRSAMYFFRKHGWKVW